MSVDPDPTPTQLAEPQARFWIAMWALLVVGVIVGINALLAWSGNYNDGFRELSTLAVTGVLASAAGNNTQRRPTQ